MIRDATEADFEAILALNDGSVHATSPLDRAALRALHDQSSYHRVIDADGGIAAFLLAVREGQPYESPNYRWFVARYPSFLYIDRVIVAREQRRRGLGALLYEDLFAFARKQGLDLIACEYDIDPPNEPSEAFHARFGFEQVGTQTVQEGAKRVALAVVRPGPGGYDTRTGSRGGTA